MQTILIVFLGGAIGSVGRYYGANLIMQLSGGTFPFGTMFVNVTGAIVIGFVAGLAAPESPFLINPRVRLFLMTGVCGGYTTFSTFSLETFSLLNDGQWLTASLNAGASVFLCITAVWIGMTAARLLGGGV